MQCRGQSPPAERSGTGRLVAAGPPGTDAGTFIPVSTPVSRDKLEMQGQPWDMAPRAGAGSGAARPTTRHQHLDRPATARQGGPPIAQVTGPSSVPLIRGNAIAESYAACPAVSVLNLPS
jgi:hypothetical protein